MRRIAILIAVVTLVAGVVVSPATASDDDRRDDDETELDDEIEDDDEDDDEEDDDDGRRRRRRNRNRGGDGDDARGAADQPTGGTSPSTPAPQATVQVNDRSFSPQTVSVAVGGTVTWDNVSREHTVTADDSSFDSGVIDAGQTFRQTFATAGSVAYKCLIHPEMTGTVVVGERQGSAPSASSSQADSSTSASASGRSSGQPSLGAPVRPPVAAAANGTADVEVVDFDFTPADITISPGTTVRWTLTGQAPHTVTSDAFDSRMLQSGATFEHTFTDVGTVDYRCELHPEMQGTVAVVEGAGDAVDAGDAAGGDDRGGGAGVSAAPQATASAGLANTGLRLGLAALAALAALIAGTAAVLASRRRRSRPARTM